MIRGRVVKLDRGFPLVRTEDNQEFRCKHATTLIKDRQSRAAIGDWVELEIPERHDKAIIQSIEARKNSLVRKDPAEQALPQILATNFDIIFIAQPITDINLRRFERELVLAHETEAEVIVLLTKADLSKNKKDSEKSIACVQALLDNEKLLVLSAEDKESIENVRACILPGKTAVLVGKSGVGKSSLVNLLVGKNVQDTKGVRENDGKGRHTTVSREMVEIPGGGEIIDMPGVRGLGLWDAETGLKAAFVDIEQYAQGCKFRDCSHKNEPGCAVRAACEAGEISKERWDSYRALKNESKDIKERRKESEHLHKKALGKAFRNARSRRT